MKALEILKWSQDNIPNSHLDRLCGENWDNFISEAIKELEELNNRSCGSCKYWDYKDNTTTIETCNFGLIDHSYNASSFCCNRYEAKS